MRPGDLVRVLDGRDVMLNVFDEWKNYTQGKANHIGYFHPFELGMILKIVRGNKTRHPGLKILCASSGLVGWVTSGYLEVLK